MFKKLNTYRTHQLQLYLLIKKKKINTTINTLSFISKLI